MTAPAVLRVVPVAAGDVDAALGLLPWLHLVRTDAGIFLACSPELADVARTLLARTGVRAEPSDVVPGPPRAFVPARAVDLVPVPLSGIVDTLALRPLATGEAAKRLLRRRFIRRGHANVDGVRAVLHGEERLIGWRRVVWTDRGVLRARELRGTRPVVFDRDAVSRGEERWILAGAGAIGRWLRM